MTFPPSSDDPQQAQPTQPQQPQQSYAPPTYVPQPQYPQPQYPPQTAYPSQPLYPPQPAYPSQPMAQPPMAQYPPAAPVKVTMDTKNITAPDRILYLFAGIAALVAIIAAIALPFATVSTPGVSVFGQTVTPTTIGTLTGMQLSGAASIALLCAIVGLAAAATGALAVQGIPSLTPKMIAGTTAGAGAATLLLMLLSISAASSTTSVFGVTTSTSSPAFGLWVAILAAGAMTAFGALQFTRTK